MHVEVVATLACEAKNCPTTYRTDHDTFLVQGTLVTDPALREQLGVPANEALLEVPAELLEKHSQEVQV